MKKIFLFVALTAIFMWGCEEAPLNIPDLKVGARRVLIEELTGVKCTNCPDGTRLLETLQQTYGKENLVVVSIHAVPDFSVPFGGANPSLYDFRTDDGTALANFISAYEGVPCASIARFLPANATSRFITPPGEWPSLINAEFAMFHLTEEHLAVQQAARDFAQNELKPGVIERDSKGNTPTNKSK
jgi:hypothetical protein